MACRSKDYRVVRRQYVLPVLLAIGGNSKIGLAVWLDKWGTSFPTSGLNTGRGFSDLIGMRLISVVDIGDVFVALSR